MKWVVNLSRTLTLPQEVMLAHEPNFAVSAPNSPCEEYITTIELVCQSLNTNEAEEPRADIYRALWYSHPLKLKLSKEKWKALKQLKTDKDHIILTADKGVALVVKDRQDYIKKPGPFWKTPVFIGLF